MFRKYALTLFCFGVCPLMSTAFAQQQTADNEVEGIVYQCAAVDSNGQFFWGSQSFGQRGAEKRAISSCEKSSEVPDSCKISKCTSDYECHGYNCR